MKVEVVEGSRRLTIHQGSENRYGKTRTYDFVAPSFEVSVSGLPPDTVVQDIVLLKPEIKVGSRTYEITPDADPYTMLIRSQQRFVPLGEGTNLGRDSSGSNPLTFVFSARQQLEETAR